MTAATDTASVQGTAFVALADGLADGRPSARPRFLPKHTSAAGCLEEGALRKKEKTGVCKTRLDIKVQQAAWR